MHRLAIKDWTTIHRARCDEINRRVHEDAIQAAKTRFLQRLLCSGASMSAVFDLYSAVIDRRYNL
jgi:hypothetical protein